MRRAAIHDIVFQAAALGQRHATWPPSLSVHIPAGANHKGFTQQLPLFARRPPMSTDDGSFPAYCGLLKDLGIPLQTRVQALEPLSVANVPIRFARRGIDEGYDTLELETAEALEISCSREFQRTRVGQFPLEITDWQQLKLQLDTLRGLSSTHTPIGLGIVAGDVQTDMTNALIAQADFVILELPASGQRELSESDLDLLVWSVTSARAACTQGGAPTFPIFLDAPIDSTDDLVKLLALGASAVSIDAIAQACLPRSVATSAVTPKGMLSGIGAIPAKAPALNITPLESKLTELIAALNVRLHQQQLSHVRDLTAKHLRALSEPAAGLTGLSVLNTNATR